LKKRLVSLLLFAALVSGPACSNGDGRGGGEAAKVVDGKAVFDKYCASCHKGGGNVVNPVKTLSRSDREANGIKSSGDIIKIIRNPGPGMPAFDQGAISDDEAKALAEYVLSTF
jgi:cytochrome c6